MKIIENSLKFLFEKFSFSASLHTKTILVLINIHTYFFLSPIMFGISKRTTKGAGLEGFGPSTAGLRVLCATWLRHRPTKIDEPRVVINLEIRK